MKLLYCPACFDVLKFSPPRRHRTCDCGKSWGHYQKGGIEGEIGGLGIPLAIGNKSFTNALAYRPEIGEGAKFEAFVIPKNSKTVKSDGDGARGIGVSEAWRN